MEELIKLYSEVKQYCVYAHYYEDQLFYIGSGKVYRNNRGLRGRPFNFNNRSMDWFFFCNGEIDKVTVKILFVTNDEKISYDKEAEITIMYMNQGFPLVNKNIGNHPGEAQKKQHSVAMSGENNPVYGTNGYWLGKKHSEETKNKISSTLKGREVGEETRKKISEANKRRIFSEETRNKIGLAHKGKKRSEETKRKISEANKGGKNPSAKKVLITNNETGEAKIFDSVVSAHEFISEKGYSYQARSVQKRLCKGKFIFSDYTLEKIK